MTHRSHALHALSIAAVAGAGALAGCGGDSSPSKPAYCSDVSALKQSVKGFSVTSGGISGVESQLNTIRTQADSAVSSAKGDFPKETNAVNSSVSSLTTAVKQLSTSASAADLVALVPMAASVKDAVTGFTSAVDAKC
jgi:hypothetical protein